MTIIANCTYVRLKRLKILTAHRRDVDPVNQYGTQLRYFILYTISSMQDFLGRLECNQGPYAFDSGLYLTSFKLHSIESGGVQTQRPEMAHKIFITHIHKIPGFIQLLCTQYKFPIRRIGKGKFYQIDNKIFNKLVHWKNDTSMDLTLNQCIGYRNFISI